MPSLYVNTSAMFAKRLNSSPNHSPNVVNRSLLSFVEDTKSQTIGTMK